MADPFPQSFTLASILSSIPPQEHQDLRGRIGEHLIGEVEDLCREVEVLRGIWEEYRGETEKVLETASTKSNVPTLLQGPAFQRSILLEKIHVLVKGFQQSHTHDKLTSSWNERELAIVNHVTIHQQLGSISRRPLSAASCTSSTGCNRTEATDELIIRIRQALESEKLELLAQVDDLQHALDDERDLRIHAEGLAVFQPPTLQELGKLCEKLESIHDKASKQNSTPSISRTPSFQPRAEKPTLTFTPPQTSPTGPYALSSPIRDPTPPNFVSPPHHRAIKLTKAPTYKSSSCSTLTPTPPTSASSSSSGARRPSTTGSGRTVSGVGTPVFESFDRRPTPPKGPPPVASRRGVKMKMERGRVNG